MTASSKRPRKSGRKTLRKIAEEVRGGHNFLLSTHENPEGDAIGSVLALGWALRGLGKRVEILVQDPVPEVLAFLPGVQEIIHQAPTEAFFDLALAVDCGDRARLGEEFGKLKAPGKIINIDHHVSNSYYGDINFVDPAASSAAEIVFDLLRIIPVPLNREIAENLYTGLLTDTGSFHYSNTTPKTFAAARACLQAGVEPWRVAEQVYENQPLARLRLLPRVLETLEVSEEGRVSHVVITREMLAEAKASPALTEDFINFPRSIKGVEVAILFREVSPEKTRVSFRSRGSVDVARIAEGFQGGGHRSASGCTIKGSLADAKTNVLQVVRAAL